MKGVFQGAKLVQDTTKSPNVRLVSVGLVLANLWRHVIWSSLHGHGVILSAFKNFRYTEVSKLDGIIFGQEDILGFDISVQYLATVYVMKR